MSTSSWFQSLPKKDRPIRYFVAETLGTELGILKRRFDDAVYWVKCHTLPEYRGYSFIDLRKPGPGIEYKYGWIDRSEAMLYAAMVCLRQYIEHEKPIDPADHSSPEEIEADVVLKNQKAQFDEAMAIYNWWMKGRLEEEAEEDRLRDIFWALKAKKNTPERDKASKEYLEYRRWRCEREDEMLLRLCKIRGSLWT